MLSSNAYFKDRRVKGYVFDDNTSQSGYFKRFLMERRSYL